MGRTVGVLIGLAGIAVICVSRAAPAAAPPPADPLVKRVQAAIDNGVRFLRNEQQSAGQWEHDRSSSFVGMLKPNGMTCLVMLALLNSGVRPDDPTVQRGLEYLRKIDLADTYVVGLQTMVLAEVGDPKDLSRIQRNVDWLIKARVLNDGKLRGWGYNENLRTTDNSNSQYALLGLYAGKHAGAKVEEAVWNSIFQYYKDTQTPEGGWIYSSDYDHRAASLTMTVAGLCGLEIAGQELNAIRRKLAPDGSDPQCGVYPENEPIRKALYWLGEGNAPVSRFQFFDPSNTYYNVYGIERAGRLTGKRELAGVDWYRDGCRFLLDDPEARQHEDGTWFRSGIPALSDRVTNIATSFALLFLSKGRTPILISKFAHDPGEDWNNKHHDARHLAEFASKELFKRQPLAWQVYDARHTESLNRNALRGEVGTLLQSPILYMNGHRAPQLSGIQKRLLQDYLNEGGFLLAEACCGRPEFADRFRALMKELFPDTELAPLRPDHPIWSAHFAVNPGFVPLEGIEQGCKTVVVFSPKPLAGYWEINQWTPRAGGLDIPPTDRGTQAFRLAGNIIAYATGMEMPKPRLTTTELTDDRDDRHVPRGFLQVAQLKHEGDWQPAPRAMTNLMKFMRTKHKLDVALQKEELEVRSPDIIQFKFLYMHGRKAFDIPAEQLEDLRANLRTGGLLLADACCGKVEFDRSFRTFAKRLFPDANLEPIPPDDPLFGADINGEPITTVRLRKERPDGQGAETEFRDTRPTGLEGIKANGRWAVIYSRYDIGCALEKHASSDCKGYDHESALHLGAAAVLYSLKK